MVSIIIPVDRRHSRNLERLRAYCKRMKIKGGGKTTQDQFYVALDLPTASKLQRKAESLGFLPFLINHYEET